MPKRIAKIALIVAAILTVLIVLAIWQRHILLATFAGPGEPPPMLENVEDLPGGEWFDDYFVVVALNESTFAIAEPRYWQKNFNYLILGEDKALLFDAGSGYRDIRPVVEHLTDLPVTFLPSHLHYDHIGNQITFDHVALVDLPHLREQAKDGRLPITWEQHFGGLEGVPAPTLEIDEWIEPGTNIDLGNRKLRVVFTPGHTDDSISLVDEQNRFIFTGDFIYPGPLAAIFPNSGMADYLQGAANLIESAPSDSVLFGGHSLEEGALPSVPMDHVVDLRETLRQIRDGELSGTGVFPRTYVINDELEFWAEPRMLQNWEQSYPDP